MNSSSAPANNENVAYGHILSLSGKLKRADQVNLVRALAGQLGMIAMFPAQLSQTAGNPKGAKAPKDKKKGPATQAATNPLSGSAEKKAFDAAKKAVASATKAAGGQKLPADHELVRGLETAKDQYFRALSNAKGKKSEDDESSSDEDEKALASAISGSKGPSPGKPGESSKAAAGPSKGGPPATKKPSPRK